MPLTDEQRSMLQLLLEGGQGYDDIASLLGVSGDEVRSRVRAALREMGGADPDSQVVLSDYLLGKADPIGRADAVRHLQGDPEANALAQRLLGQLRLLAPNADLPELPPARGGRRAAAPAPGGAPAPSRTAPGESPVARVRSRLGARDEDDPRRARILAVLGVAAILVIAVVLVVVLTGDDGGGGGDDAEQTNAATDDELVIAQLAPLSGGSSATGQAVFAQTQDQPLLQLNLSGLQPAGEGRNYIVWLYNSPQAAFPIARDQVNDQGNLTGAAPIPSELTSALAAFGCIDISLASNAETRRVLQQAVKGQALPAHTGQTVLRGQIPAPGETAPSGANSVCDAATAGAAEGAGATPTDPGELEGATPEGTP